MTRSAPRCSAMLCLVLLGCAHALAPKEPPSSALGPERAFVSDRRSNGGELFNATMAEGTYFGATGARGSLAAGLLLGPLGVLGNTLYVESKNREHAESLQTLAATNLPEVLSRAVPGLERRSSNDEPSYELMPIAVLRFADDRSYHLTCVMTAELHETPAAASWSSHYWVAVEGTFDVSMSDDTARAIAALEPCLREAHQLFVDHLSGRLGPFAPKIVALRTDGGGTLDVHLQVSQSASTDRIVTSDPRGVQSLPASAVLSVH